MIQSIQPQTIAKTPNATTTPIKPLPPPSLRQLPAPLFKHVPIVILCSLPLKQHTSYHPSIHPLAQVLPLQHCKKHMPLHPPPANASTLLPTELPLGQRTSPLPISRRQHALGRKDCLTAVLCALQYVKQAVGSVVQVMVWLLQVTSAVVESMVNSGRRRRGRDGGLLCLHDDGSIAFVCR